MGKYNYYIFVTCIIVASSILIAFLTTENLKDGFLISVIVSLLGGMLTLSAADFAVATKNRKSLTEIEAKWDSLYQAHKGQSRVLDVLQRLLEKNSVIGRTGLKALDEFFKEFEVSEQGYRASSEYLALKSYKEFCRELLTQQISNNNSGKPGLVMRITHTGPIEIWGEKEAINILNLQYLFVLAGGKVLRIFIDSEPNPTAVDAYAAVIREMDGYGIQAYYLRKPDLFKQAGSSEESDFITIDGFDDIMMWKSTFQGSRINGCEFRRDAHGEFSAKWHRYAEMLMDQKLPEEFDEELRNQEMDLQEGYVRELLLSGRQNSFTNGHVDV